MSCVLATSGLARAQDSVSARHTEYLLALGRLWATIKYFHPSIDDSHPELWDNTALAAIPGAIAAESTEQFVSAARAMVGTLGDPVTRVERADSRPRRTSLFMAAYEEFARSARSN